MLINANCMPLIKIFLLFSYSKYNAWSFLYIDLDDINSYVVKNASSFTAYSHEKSLNVVVSWPRTELGRRSFKHCADTVKQLEIPLSFKKKIKSIKTYVRYICFQKECSVTEL